ncbi:hypothetical protein VPNG_05053 [Cytospora leucostoma]|uniref:Uncharacterized protein n=1 Tax=Cytospora leucostoma TaxID=1230097 RepID=A0A423X4B3_9PEZI|nr:hypothetical protein VPNG_05053 [Cytospora leucostoma]
MDHDGTTGDGSWKSRNCLSPGEYARSWSLAGTANTRVLLRRVLMWTIILLRIVQTVIIIAYKTFTSRATSIAFGILFGILSFLFVVWCLTAIDRAQGRRRICGLSITRLHLDIFVACCAAAHLVLLIGFWTFLRYISFNVSWFSLWALIALYGFICSKPPVEI